MQIFALCLSLHYFASNRYRSDIGCKKYGHQKVYYWEGGMIPYYSDFQDEQKEEYLSEAIYEIQNKTCIR